MAILENDYMKYDYDRHEYYITEELIANEIPYEDDEIKRRVDNLIKLLPRYSRRIYQHIYYSNQNSARQFIHYKIYKNEFFERQAIQDAIVEYVMGALESGMDLNLYEQETKSDMPSSVEYTLRNAKLLRVGAVLVDFDYLDEVYGTDY
jgi:hypothetical protein